jgi:hypothetical protein
VGIDLVGFAHFAHAVAFGKDDGVVFHDRDGQPGDAPVVHGVFDVGIEAGEGLRPCRALGGEGGREGEGEGNRREGGGGARAAVEGGPNHDGRPVDVCDAGRDIVY